MSCAIPKDPDQAENLHRQIRIFAGFKDALSMLRENLLSIEEMFINRHRKADESTRFFLLIVFGSRHFWFPACILLWCLFH